MSVSLHRDLIRRYYEDFWNGWNFALAPSLLADDIAFRGSLGVDVQGISEFLSYMDLVRTAFPDFHNFMEDVIAGDAKVFARLRYTGTHRGPVFGIPATGRSITYEGAALFRVHDGKIRQAWVLGDALALLRSLEGATAASTEMSNGRTLAISAATREEARWAAALMSASEPWKTLGRDTAACLRVFDDRTVLPFIARLDRQPCGFMVLRRRGVADSPYIKSLAVAEEFRGQGIGRRLIAFAENLYRQEARSLFVCVSSFNPRARALYERLGYRAVGEFPAYLVAGHSEILLEKRLSA